MGIASMLGIVPALAKQEYDKKQAEIDLMKQEMASMRDEEAQRNKIIGMKKGGKVKSKASSASKRGDGIAQRGKTKGRFV